MTYQKQILSFLLLWGAAMCSSLSADPIIADVVFHNVHIIPMHEELVLENKAVAVRDGIIVAVVDTSEASSIEAPKRIDGEGRYLMPGLADMHVHVRWNPQTMFELFLAHGVTTVANMRIGDGKDLNIDHLALRSEIASGKRLGPRYYVSGPHFEDDYPASLEEVEVVLNEHVEAGYDFVKVHGDLPPDIYDALMKGIRSRDLRAIGHGQHKRPLHETLRLDTLEHAEELLYTSMDPEFGPAFEKDFLKTYREHAELLRDPAYRAPMIEAIAQSGIHVDPTLIVYKMVGEWESDAHLAAIRNDPKMVYLSASVKDRWLGPKNPYQEEGFPIKKAEIDRNLEVLFMLVKDLNDAGVPLLLGTDTFGTLIPGHSIHQELALLVEAGLSPYEALKAGTVNIAAYLNEANRAGAILEEHRADFILLDRNPLSDIANSQSVSGVYSQKRWHSRIDIEQFKQNAIQQATQK